MMYAMKRKEVGTVKTTIELPEDLWRKAKIKAVDERSDLRSIIIAALETHLRSKSPKREG
jgi:Na+-transporting methylmalonyl-CoA/oxaloacetate decarboxylase gamma subunit